MNPGAVIIAKFLIEYYTILVGFFAMRIFSMEPVGRTSVVAPEQAMTHRPGYLRIDRLPGACRPSVPRYP